LVAVANHLTAVVNNYSCDTSGAGIDAKNCHG
jgi:hypothetical protein